MLELPFGIPTAWFISVWNCHGKLTQHGWGDDLPKGLVWLKVGHFSVPIPENEQSLWDERLKHKVNMLLHTILQENGGAINISGVYPVFLHQIEQIMATVAKYSKPTSKPTTLEKLFEGEK